MTVKKSDKNLFIRGEIATILTIAVLLVVGMTTFISSLALKGKKTTSTKASEADPYNCQLVPRGVECEATPGTAGGAQSVPCGMCGLHSDTNEYYRCTNATGRLRFKSDSNCQIEEFVAEDKAFLNGGGTGENVEDGDATDGSVPASTSGTSVNSADSCVGTSLSFNCCIADHRNCETGATDPNVTRFRWYGCTGPNGCTNLKFKGPQIGVACPYGVGQSNPGPVCGNQSGVEIPSPAESVNQCLPVRCEQFRVNTNGQVSVYLKNNFYYEKSDCTGKIITNTNQAHYEDNLKTWCQKNIVRPTTFLPSLTTTTTPVPITPPSSGTCKNVKDITIKGQLIDTKSTSYPCGDNLLIKSPDDNFPYYVFRTCKGLRGRCGYDCIDQNTSQRHDCWAAQWSQGSTMVKVLNKTGNPIDIIYFHVFYNRPLKPKSSEYTDPQIRDENPKSLGSGETFAFDLSNTNVRCKQGVNVPGAKLKIELWYKNNDEEQPYAPSYEFDCEDDFSALIVIE